MVDSDRLISTVFSLHIIFFQDSILLGDNLKFDFEDVSEVSELRPFLDKLTNQVIRTSFFQGEIKEDINILKIPIIMADCILGTMTNTEGRKKTLMNTNQKYNKDVLANFLKMVSNKRIDILGLDKLDSSQLKKISSEIGIKTSKKSNTVLLEELKSLARIFLAGQGKTSSTIYLSYS